MLVGELLVLYEVAAELVGLIHFLHTRLEFLLLKPM